MVHVDRDESAVSKIAAPPKTDLEKECWSRGGWRVDLGFLLRCAVLVCMSSRLRKFGLKACLSLFLHRSFPQKAESRSNFAILLPDD